MLEQGTGVEPAFTAWEAVVLPIYEPCILIIITERFVKCKRNSAGRGAGFCIKEVAFTVDLVYYKTKR